MDKHKHYAVIMAWAEGRPIQFKTEQGEWADVYAGSSHMAPTFADYTEYRVKPQDVVLTRRVYVNHNLIASFDVVDGYKPDNVEFTFDGETLKLVGVRLLGGNP